METPARYISMIAAVLMLCPLCACAQTKCENYEAKVIRKYPHDTGAYTQGLFFWNGSLYESTGQNGKSSLRKVDLQTGRPYAKKDFNKKYFGEGSCVVDGRLYMLTWTNRVAFVYDPLTLEYQKTFAYPREGWGLTALPQKDKDGAVMVASDGSSTLFFLDENMQTVHMLPVKINGKPLRLLNELEWIDGRIWANIYTTDFIAIINPQTGMVEGRIDCRNLIPDHKRTPQMDVLNGIAVNDKGQIYLTGKNWPSMFEIELVKKK